MDNIPVFRSVQIMQNDANDNCDDDFEERGRKRRKCRKTPKRKKCKRGNKEQKTPQAKNGGKGSG